jgi:threonine dehydratase
MNFERPSFNDVLEARSIIQSYLPRTPLYSYPQLNELLSCEAYIKHENHQPVGAFKVRGGINLLYHMTKEQRGSGVVTASTGNHAQSIAYAGRIFNAPVTIVMPERANPVKVNAVKALGADIIFHGKVFDQAREHAQRLAAERGARFIHPANEPYLIAGVATYAIEILEDCPKVDMIIVPVGGGSGAAGCCIVKQEIRPELQVIGVQAEKAPAAYLSWKNRRIMEDKMETVAEGLATNVGYELTQEILWDYLAEFILVSEDEMVNAILAYMELTRNMVEEAGAAPLAAALKIKERIRGKKVALILTGGNISMQRLKQIIRM